MSGSNTPLVSNTPAPAMPSVTGTAPSGMTTGITTTAPVTTQGPMPQTDGVVGVRDLARIAGARDAEVSPEDWHKQVQAAQKTYANHPYYQGKEGSDTENANAQFGKPGAKK